MRPYPADAIPEERLRALRLLAADIDDTLTQGGKITPELLDHLFRLRAGGVRVWLVTGRCAAWGQALAHYFDFDGVVAENGGVLCRGEAIRVLADRDRIGPGRKKLAEVFEKIRAKIPRATITDDNIGRVTDWTFDRGPLGAKDLAMAGELAREEGLQMVASSIHVHLFAGDHTKATALGEVCEKEGIVDRETVLTLGDSPNDAPLFDPDCFPFSVAVANVAKYLDILPQRPLYILPHPEAEGALWLIRRILVTKGL